MYTRIANIIYMVCRKVSCGERKRRKILLRARSSAHLLFSDRPDEDYSGSSSRRSISFFSYRIIGPKRLYWAQREYAADRVLFPCAYMCNTANTLSSIFVRRPENIPCNSCFQKRYHRPFETSCTPELIHQVFINNQIKRLTW